MRDMPVRPEQAVRALRERLAATRTADEAAARQAREALPSIVAALRRAGVQQAFLFGSLATGSFRSGSDIDVAVSGVSPWRILRLQEELAAASRLRVDLVPLQAAQPWLREAILRTGERIL